MAGEREEESDDVWRKVDMIVFKELVWLEHVWSK